MKEDKEETAAAPKQVRGQAEMGGWVGVKVLMGRSMLTVVKT